MCKLGLLVSKKSKRINAVKGKGMMNSDTMWEECSGGMDIIQLPNNGDELNLNLIKYQNDGLVCPYDFEEICTKFVTNNSVKKSVQEIGLIGSNGIQMLAPSVSPYLFDPALMLVPPKEMEG